MLLDPRNTEMKIIFLLFAVLPILSGCALHGVIRDDEQLSPEQKTYLQEIKEQPLTFDMPKSEANDAWARAQAFIVKLSDRHISKVTDFLLETHDPTSEKSRFGTKRTITVAYRVVRIPIGDKYQFEVTCFGPDNGEEILSTANRNARIMANYISTGKLPHPELVVRCVECHP